MDMTICFHRFTPFLLQKYTKKPAKLQQSYAHIPMNDWMRIVGASIARLRADVGIRPYIENVDPYKPFYRAVLPTG